VSFLIWCTLRLVGWTGMALFMTGWHAPGALLLRAAHPAHALFSADRFAAVQQGPGERGRHEPVQVASTRKLTIGGATLQIDIAPGKFDLGEDAVVAHVETAARAVAAYFGKFPVPRARILIIPAEGAHGVMHGTTWGGVGWGGNRDGAGPWPGFTRIAIGTQTTKAELEDDWMMTHELTHMAFPPCRTRTTGWKRGWPPT
jgi:hypothetical protein